MSGKPNILNHKNRVENKTVVCTVELLVLTLRASTGELPESFQGVLKQFFVDKNSRISKHHDNKLLSNARLNNLINIFFYEEYRLRKLAYRVIRGFYIVRIIFVHYQ